MTFISYIANIVVQNDNTLLALVAVSPGSLLATKINSLHSNVCCVIIHAIITIQILIHATYIRTYIYSYHVAPV